MEELIRYFEIKPCILSLIPMLKNDIRIHELLQLYYPKKSSYFKKGTTHNSLIVSSASIH